MFNVVINNEQYDEYLAQKAQIKELEARNEFLKTQYDQLNGKYQANIEKIKALEASNALLKGNLESTYGNYQQSLSVKAALIKERNELINERSELYIENEALKNKNIRFKELVTENYRLKMSNNDLKENNKKLKEQNEALKDGIAEMAEEATNPDYVKFLEAVKKFQEYNVAARLDVLEEFPPACNFNIENLYITNNYFSEEDKDNE